MSFASGCATFRGLGGSGKREKTVSGVQGAAQGQWRGQALIRDRRAGKSVTLQLEIVAREPDRLRLEANGGLGALGAHVASIALNQGQVQAILTQERVFLIGSASSAAALRFLPIRLTPQELMFVLFDRQMPPQRPEWRCDLDGSGRPLICSREADAVNIRWHERTVDFRRIEISAPDVTMQVILEEAKTDLALSDDVFVLSAPANFRREVLDDQ